MLHLKVHRIFTRPLLQTSLLKRSMRHYPLSLSLSMSRRVQRNAITLTPELWAEVFPHLEERSSTATVYDDLEQKQRQKEVHQLKLVCKQFRQIHASHPGLVHKVHLYSDFFVRSLPSLLVWLQHNKSSVQILQSACGSPVLDAVLAGLVSPESDVRVVNLDGVSTCSTALIATFPALQKCSLQHNQNGPLDLEPLGALSRLDYLVLQGRFRGVHNLAGLTRLDCIQAEVFSVHDFKCIATLQHLELEGSSFAWVHTISACTALTKLKFSDTELTNSIDQMLWDSDLSVIPFRTDLLTQLHTLYLSTGSNASQPASLGWISKLVNHQDLSVSFGSCLSQVVHHASLLPMLTSLHILGLDAHLAAPYVLDIGIAWHRLQMLQHLSICFCSLKLDRSVAGLLELPLLRQVSFGGSTVHDSNEADCFTALIYGLARVCPHVKVVVDSGDVLRYFN